MAVAARAQSDGGVTSTASGAPLESVPEWTHGRFKALLLDCRFSAAEIETIDRAYDLAKSAHFRFQRQGGDRYFEHCRAVALILIQEAGVRDVNIIAAALLHDSVEDTSIFGSTAVNSVDGVREVARTRLTDFFNERVAEYVLSVTKFHKSGDTETDRAHKKEYYERMYDAPAGALLIKMADRLHNLRSLSARPLARQYEQYEETTQVLLPIFTAAKARCDSESYRTLLSSVRLEREMLEKRLGIAHTGD